MISLRQIISVSAGPIFATFTPNESILRADDQSGPLFVDISKDVAMTTDFVIKWQTPQIHCSGIQKRNGISLPQCAHQQRK